MQIRKVRMSIFGLCVFEVMYTCPAMRSALWKVCVCPYVCFMTETIHWSSIEFRIVSVVSTQKVPFTYLCLL
jgi:hypothetical protein